MPDYFDEVADLVANSRTVGPYVDRATLLANLRSTFPTEQALREYMDQLWRAAHTMMSNPNTVGLLVPPKPGETTWELLCADPQTKDDLHSCEHYGEVTSSPSPIATRPYRPR